MASPKRIESLNDVKMWIAANDARIDAFWDQQHKWNDTADKKFYNFRLRLEAVEKRVVWIAGIASGLGSTMGFLLSKLL